MLNMLNMSFHVVMSCRDVMSCHVVTLETDPCVCPCQHSPTHVKDQNPCLCASMAASHDNPCVKIIKDDDNPCVKPLKDDDNLVVKLIKDDYNPCVKLIKDYENPFVKLIKGDDNP